MNPLKAAALLLPVLLASPCAAQIYPADFDKTYEALRLKARTAYLAPAPIDLAVPVADLKKLEPLVGPPPSPAEQQKNAARLKKTAELAEALDAVRTLQGEAGKPALVAEHKGRLMVLVNQRLGLSEGEQTKAGASYHSGVAAPGPFSAEPSQAVLARSQAGADQSRARAGHVMAGSAALGDGRGAGPGAAGLPAGGRGGSPSAAGASAAEFRPHYAPGHPAQAVPAAPAAAAHEPSYWERAVAVAKTPLPGLSGAAEAYEKFAERRMARSDELEREGAALLEKGGVGNTVAAGWNAVKGWGNRLAAGDSRAVTEVAIGAAAVTVAIVAAPVVAAAAAGAGTAVLVGGALHVAVAGVTAYGAVKGTAALIKEPNYVTAGALAVNFLGAKYAEPLAGKVGQLVAGKSVVAAVETGATATAAVAAAPMLARAAAVTAEEVAPQAVRVAAVKTTEKVLVKAAEKTTEVVVEGGHHVVKEAVVDAFEGEHSVPVKEKPEPARAR